MALVTEQINNDVVVRGIGDYSVDQIFDCGQCFRFEPCGEHTVEGVAFGRYLKISQPCEDTIILHGTTLEEYENIWKDFLALETDYEAIKEEVSQRFGEVINEAIALGHGIRILRQDSWEAVCSFIISQNNNIPRIKKIIREMCAKYGEPIDVTEEDGTLRREYSFPSPKVLYEAGEEAIFALRTGFRAKYIYDAARKLSCGEMELSSLNELSTDEAAKALMGIKGIGPKVAACALLFGFGKTDAFPVDVWMKRILARYYPDGLEISALGEYAGIGQQYLFYYVRYINPTLE